MTNEQKEFIWLDAVELMPFADIAQKLNVSRKTLTEWGKDAVCAEERRKLAEIVQLYKRKISRTELVDFENFRSHYAKLHTDKRCHYCGITELEIEKLWEVADAEGHKLSKSGRGRRLEWERKDPHELYDNLDNNVLACYWCNNAKTDTFTEEEFKPIGLLIKQIWQNRLQHSSAVAAS